MAQATFQDKVITHHLYLYKVENEDDFWLVHLYGRLIMKMFLDRLTPSLLYMLAIIVVCTSCRANSTPDVDIVISEGSVNTIIVLTAPKEWNTFQINTQVCLWVELISDFPVILRDNDVEVSELISNEWVPVEIEEDTSPVTYILYPSENAALRGATICVHPTFGDRTDPISLRFMVFGNLYKEEIVGDQTMAYLDLILYP